MSTKKLAEDYVDNHGAPSLGRQLDSLLAYVVAQDRRKIAAWLDGLGCADAARRLRDGEP